MVVGLLLAALIGVALGMLGGGGSILTVPLLMYVMNLEPKVAIATSLFVVGVTSLVGSVAYARAGRVRYRMALAFGSAGMVGAFVGGRVAQLIPASYLLVGFSSMMFATAVAMLRGRKDSPAAAPKELPLVKVFALGTFVGMLTGLVGAGGGFLIVPALSLLGGLPMGAAVGTSLLVIAMNSLAGSIGHLGHVSIRWDMALSVTGVASVGTLVGAFYAHRVPPAKLRQGFGLLILLMSLYLLSKQALALR